MYIERERDTYVCIHNMGGAPRNPAPRNHFLARIVYSQFSKCHVCFCGLDPGNSKFETVRTNKQHICF